MFACVCLAALVEFTEADEALADQALLGDVFLFMKEGILACESFAQEEFFIRRLHSLITDFLALMPMKVSDGICVLLQEYISMDIMFWSPLVRITHI